MFALNNLFQDLSDYMDFLTKDKRCTKATIKNYRSTLNKFVEQYEDLDTRSVRTFLRSVDHAESRNTYLVRLKGFATFLDISLSKIPRAKEVVKDPDALISSELESVCSVGAQMDSQFGHGLTLLCHTGLRIHEFYNLREQHLEMEQELFRLRVLGKGQKIRVVPLHDEALEAFCEMKKPFPIPEKRFRVMLHEVGAAIGKQVHPHLLRASCASIMMNERHVDSATVCRILGWSKVDTMAKHYYKPSAAILHEAVR